MNRCMAVRLNEFNSYGVVNFLWLYSLLQTFNPDGIEERFENQTSN